MHKSLITKYKEEYLQPVPDPVCEIIDFHMHVCGGNEDEKYKRIAKEYGVVKAGAMLHWTSSAEVIDNHDGFFFPIEWMRMPEIDSESTWVDKEIDRINKDRLNGLVALKLRSTCKEGRPKVWIDHPYIIEVLKEVSNMGLFIYIHIAEPSGWWPKVFDPLVVGNKIDYHKPVETILQQCPNLNVVGAHLGGYPEDLDFLEKMLSKYPKYSLDMSATKWIVRELGRNVDKSRAFIEKFQDRLYFGSDLVAFLSDGQEDYYRSRFTVLRHLFESDKTIPSMIIDPDALPPDYPDGPEVRGLGLEKKILQRIYRDNALELIK